MTDSSTQPTDESASSADHIEGEDTFDRLVDNEARVLVDFYADWCGPCQLMAPIVDELAAETEVPVAKVDVEKLPQVATRYDINSIPAFIVFEDGAVEEHLIGMQDKETLAQAIE